MRFIITAACALVISAAPALAAGVDHAAETLARSANISPDAAKDQIRNVFSAIETELKAGREVTVKNFGRFYVQDRDARNGRNPRTGAPLAIPAKRYARFASSESLKDMLNGLSHAPSGASTPVAPSAPASQNPPSAASGAKTAASPAAKR